MKLQKKKNQFGKLYIGILNTSFSFIVYIL